MGDGHALQRTGLILFFVLFVAAYGFATYKGRAEPAVTAAVVSNVEPIGERYTPEHYVHVRLPDGTVVFAEVAPSGQFPCPPGTLLRVTPRQSLFGKRTYYADAPARR